ncbi:ABC transporter substrate-binding protein [Thalassobacillus pellis]|uniref:ABC transporter substrate-binding protein n=1 Tax=Thalassobacillus pellis TaxID=748008 RepID=UPI00195F4920|nr:extracellular solute-binding protein [Thalassobacillus pellis]MBM7553305.1 raffinose/stachyose/melibiose transport system substrate-binding protein [Thalassobacillus pellis]
MLKKNKMLVFLASIIVALLFSGCQGGTADEASGEAENNEDAVQLRVLHSFTGAQPQAPVIEPAFKEFDNNHKDIDLKIETAAGNTILEQLKTEMAADDAPDVFTHWGMRRTENYIKNGVIPDISGLIEEDNLKEQYREGAFGPVTYKGGIYGLPFQGYSYYFMINKKLFEEHNVKVPTTYEELKDAVVKFKEAGYIPFAANNHSARYMLLTWFAQKKNYEDLVAHSTAEKPFGDALLEAAQKADELAELGAFPEGYMNMATAQSLELFHAEQAPMFYQHSWTIGSIDPELLKNYQVIPFPLGDSESVPTTLAGTGHFIYMSKDAYEDPEKREAAWKLMNKIAGKEVGRQFVEKIANQTPLKVEYDVDKVNPVLNEVLKNIDRSENVLPSYEEELFASAVEGEYWPLTDSLLLQKIEPKEYVEQMNAIIEENPNVQFEK